MKASLFALAPVLAFAAATLASGTARAAVENFRLHLGVDVQKCYASEGYMSCDGGAAPIAEILIPLDRCGTLPSGTACSGEYTQLNERDGHRASTTVFVSRFGEGTAARRILVAKSWFQGESGSRQITVELRGERLVDAVQFTGPELLDARIGATAAYVPSIQLAP